MKAFVVSDYQHSDTFEEEIPIDTDVLISCGDVPSHILLQILEKRDRMLESRSRDKPLLVPFFAVRGNHFYSDNFPEGVINLHGRQIYFDGLVLGGIEGAPGDERKDGNYRDTTVEFFMDSYDQWKNVNLFVAHAPPYGVNDFSNKEDDTKPGFVAFRSYVERTPNLPWYFLHGHTGSQLKGANRPLESELNGTRVICTHRARVLDI